MKINKMFESLLSKKKKKVVAPAVSRQSQIQSNNFLFVAPVFNF